MATGVGVDTLMEMEGAIAGAGNDVLIGDDGPNIFSLGDVIIVNGTRDVIDGRGAADTLSWGGSTPFVGGCCQDVTVDLGKGTASSGDTTPTLISVENVDAYLEGRFGGNHTIIGDEGPNTLRGGWGADIIAGLGGDDVLDGRAGRDRLDGGPGRNRSNGGDGRDACTNPATEPDAVSCET